MEIRNMFEVPYFANTKLQEWKQLT